jgi:hypothetical protein
MKAILELVGIFDRLKEMLTENCNKRLRMFRTMITQALKRWEKKYQTQITAPVLTEIFMVETYCKNAKSCVVIAEFFHNIKMLKKYQDTLQDLGEYKKSVKNLPTRSRATGGNQAQIGGGHPSFWCGDRVSQTFLNELQELKDTVMFATKTQHKP